MKITFYFKDGKKVTRRVSHAHFNFGGVRILYPHIRGKFTKRFVTPNAVTLNIQDGRRGIYNKIIKSRSHIVFLEDVEEIVIE